jgi:hypothetical protein
MANLSFAQRRHELSRRLVRHARSVAHVHALASSSLPAAVAPRRAADAPNRGGGGDGGGGATNATTTLGEAVRASSDALRLAREGLAAQDEAQDALYFHHGGLWKARAHCHDVLGALCVLSTPGPDGGGGGGGDDDATDDAPDDDDDDDAAMVDAVDGGDPDATTTMMRADERPRRRRGRGGGGGGGRWPDFPMDVALAVDRYATSAECSYAVPELRARLASAVRGKLVLGEVGAFGAAGSRGGGTTAGVPSTMPPPNCERAVVGGRGSGGAGRDSKPLPWRVVLEGGGGSVRLTHGAPRTASTAEALRRTSPGEGGGDGDDDCSIARLREYPMEARLSVLSEDPSAPWKLLSVRVRCSPKTGESDHQLVMNRKQMFDLHRICERAMIVEEAVCRRANEDGSKMRARGGDNGDEGSRADGPDDAVAGDGEPSAIVPRPLGRLFEVTHAFALSLQMEFLSSQAEALRRGAWGGSAGTGPTGGVRSKHQHAARDASDECIAVSPAYFYERKDSSVVGSSRTSDGSPAPIAVMAVHFWSCDDNHGSPRVGDLSLGGGEPNERKDRDDASSSMVSGASTPNYLPKNDRRGDKRLSLCIRALPTVGLVVSLSGGSDVAAEAGAKDGANNSASGHHTQRNIEKLLSSIQNPFELSMSDAILAATVLCADRRCRAMVAALNGRRTNELPPWIHLEVECGTISVAAIISYATASASLRSEAARSPTVLFRLACDSRTGRFVPVFPRPASLLRLLACNDPSASDVQSLRSSAFGAFSANSRGGNVAKRADITSRDSTGRIVRDSFDALSRSMDTLGRKCGVGGEWNDLDAQSSSLREKSVDQTCDDVRASLMTCCGMATAFGVAVIALKIACGVDPVVDM